MWNVFVLTFKLLMLAGAALFALWLISAVIGAAVVARHRRSKRSYRDRR
jgi:hypothetical protein